MLCETCVLHLAARMNQNQHVQVPVCHTFCQVRGTWEQVLMVLSIRYQVSGTADIVVRTFYQILSQVVITWHPVPFVLLAGRLADDREFPNMNNQAPSHIEFLF